MKILFVSLLFIFVSVGGVISTPLSLKLDLDVRDEDHFKIENAQLDNVFYTHFTPKYNHFVMKVYQGILKIWESKGYGGCVYALMALSKNGPSLLYLRVDNGFSVEYKYYKRHLALWVESTLSEYEKSVEELGKAVKLQDKFTLDVFQPMQDMYYTIHYSTRDRPYTYIVPKVGYWAKSVRYLKETLWSSQKEGDRCVAVWAHLNNGRYYMVRLLVTRHTNESELLTFLLKDSRWELVDSMDTKTTNKYAQRPANFVYPNYNFNFSASCPSDKNPGLKIMGNAGRVASTHNKDKSTPECPGDKSEDSPLDAPKESYFDLTGDYYKYNIQDEDMDQDESPSSVSVKSEKGVDNSQLENEYSDPEVLHLSDATTRKINVELRYVDNVLYKIYRIGKNNPPGKVVDASGTVWTARTKAERCVYVLSAQSQGRSYALYLMIEVGGESTGAYFLKVKENWVKSSLEDYKAVIEYLKKSSRKTKVALDISRNVQNVNATILYNKERSPNYMFLPKNGYAYNMVVYRNVVIWQAVEDERCVAVWSYEFFGKPYYVRLVTTDGSGKSDLISFLNTNGEWELLSSYNESAINKSRTSGPSNFFNPEYEFNQLPEYGARPLTKTKPESLSQEIKSLLPVNPMKELSEATTSASADLSTASKSLSNFKFKGAYALSKEFKGSDSSSDVVSTVNASETPRTNLVSLSEGNNAAYMERGHYLSVSKNTEGVQYLVGGYVHKQVELTQNTEHPHSTSMMYAYSGSKRELTLTEYNPEPRNFDPNMLLTIDLVPEWSKLNDRVYTVFDNQVKLVSYHAPPGYYFNLVTHATNQLFWGTVDTTLCYAVNLYLKNDEYYLCDLLLRNKYRDMTMYFKLEDGVWISIPKREYVSSLEDLRSTLGAL